MKKKGLIISTIVMVVVLIASLTTATYAWFSANAAVQVSDLTLQTKASDGLQIALNNSGTYLNGTLTYASGTGWSGEDGWGQTLDFSSLGSSGEGAQATGIISAASTYAIFTPDNSNGKWYLKDETSGARVWSQTQPENYTGDKYSVAYNQVNDNGTPKANAVHVYSSAMDEVTKLPTQLTEDPTNGHALFIPIVVTPQSDELATITCTIKVTYVPGTMAKTTLQPGMAAAGRIQVASGKIADANGSIESPTITNVLYQPFDTYHLTSSTQSISVNGTTAVGTIATTSGYTHTYTINLATSSDTIAVGDIYQTTLTIWIEGSDSECDNLTAGSGFTLAINYDFTKKSANP